MKNINIISLLILLLASACDEKFAEINTNPNAITEVNSEYLFAQATLETLRGDNNNTLQFPFGSQYAHIYVGRGDAMHIDRYYDYFESVEYKRLFEQFYFGPVRLIEQALQLTQPGGEQENEVQFAMAKVISIVNYARITDCFGSIPYREGGMGQTGIMHPEYDSVEEIYTEMMKALKEAVILLKSANPSMAFPGADPLYDNDLEKWVRFANSLRLRLAMRARFAAPTLAEGIIRECLSEPLIDENEENARDENEDTDIKEFSNPVYLYYNYWLWGMSETFVEKLKTTGDPRLTIFVKPNPAGDYIGIPNGLSAEGYTGWGDWLDVSAPGDTLVGKAAPYYLLTAAETWLLRAEAALFNIDMGDANQLYQTGIRKSFEQWGVPQEEIDIYFSGNGYATLSGSEEQQFEQISTHLWIAYMSNPAQAWANIRRTGYPRLPERTEPEFSLGVTNGILPTRLKYPSSEVNINKANYLKALEEQGPDEITTPLWWDVRN